MVLRQSTKLPLAEKIRAAVSDMGNVGCPVDDQQHDRRGAHTLSRGIVGMGSLVYLLIHAREGTSQQQDDWLVRWSLVQASAKSVDGELRRQGAPFVASHSVGDDVQAAQSDERAAHAVLVLAAGGTRVGDLADEPFW
jgi:hypothetical protein